MWELVATLELDMVESIWKCNSVSMQCPSIGSVPSVAVLGTPAACYSTGGGSNCFAYKVEHGVHSTNECIGTAMCQAASGFTPRGVLNHCALSRAHNLLNNMPSNVLDRFLRKTCEAYYTQKLPQETAVCSQ